MELGLKGRSVLVTGASRGIGRAIAESFAREGARLTLVARNGAELERLGEQLASAHGVEVAIAPMDLSVRGATRRVAEAHPNIDVLINNAGAIPRGDLLQIDEDRWRAGWELKVFGYIDMTRQYYRRMQERGAGCIVNIIGIGAEKLDYEYTAGSTGNAALVAFTRAVGSVSMDYGVRVFGVSPGTVNTDRTVRSLRFTAEALFGDAERWQELIAERPGGRLITPDEVADVVVFLSSDRGSAVSGHVVTVDAGFAARSYPHRAADRTPRRENAP